ncbi:MAG: Holliday junction branch migration protein RuvA [Chloroflexi bacterium]|nr:Holliday junction branch migration protein RuvA [Chloroflexota bacterium]
MIASLHGVLAGTTADSVVIAVNGVGYRVSVPRNSITARQDDEIFLHTEMIVREDAITLYGFSTLEERDLFNLLTRVSGVGPKLGLSVVGTMTIDGLRNAIASGHPEMLTRVPGIGKKLAEKILFELKDKLKSGDGLVAFTLLSDVNKDVMDALAGLGYSIAEAQAALSTIPHDAPDSFEERLRLALQYFV